MTFDELQDSWKCQKNEFRLKIEPEILLREVKRNHRNFKSTIFWRDVREVGISFVLIPVFLHFGIKSGLWPLYLLAVICFAVGSFMIIDRQLQKRKTLPPSDSLLDYVNSSLAQINHQIWLLRNVLWWYLAPFTIGILVWFIFCLKNVIRDNLPIIILLFFLICILGTLLLIWRVYCLNQSAISKYLKPRKCELEELLNSLKDNHV